MFLKLNLECESNSKAMGAPFLVEGPAWQAHFLLRTSHWRSCCTGDLEDTHPSGTLTWGKGNIWPVQVWDLQACVAIYLNRKSPSSGTGAKSSVSPRPESVWQTEPSLRQRHRVKNRKFPWVLASLRDSKFGENSLVFSNNLLNKTTELIAEHSVVYQWLF